MFSLVVRSGWWSKDPRQTKTDDTLSVFIYMYINVLIILNVKELFVHFFVGTVFELY